MSWTTNSPNSRVFEQAIINPIAHGVTATTGFPTSYTSQGLLTDTVNAALFNNTTTPDATVAVGSTGYNTGVWTTGNEVIDTLNSNWVAGGRTLASKAWSLDTGSTSLCFQAAALAGAGNVTITNAFGCLIYDFTISGLTVAKQGMCYNYFGGAQGVTNGTFCHVTLGSEILTKRGWLRYDQVTSDDTCLTLNTITGREEWQPVTSVHVFTDGPYDVIRLDGAGHSSVTTPDHRWPAVIPGEPGIRWYTTSTLPPDAQLLASADSRTDKVADLSVTPETADSVWCVQTPNRTWYARHNGNSFFTGNTINWATVGALTGVVIFNITV